MNILNQELPKNEFMNTMWDFAKNPIRKYVLRIDGAIYRILDARAMYGTDIQLSTRGQNGLKLFDVVADLFSLYEQKRLAIIEEL